METADTTRSSIDMDGVSFDIDNDLEGSFMQSSRPPSPGMLGSVGRDNLPRPRYKLPDLIGFLHFFHEPLDVMHPFLIWEVKALMTVADTAYMEMKDFSDIARGQAEHVIDNAVDQLCKQVQFAMSEHSGTAFPGFDTLDGCISVGVFYRWFQFKRGEFHPYASSDVAPIFTQDMTALEPVFKKMIMGSMTVHLVRCPDLSLRSHLIGELLIGTN